MTKPTRDELIRLATLECRDNRMELVHPSETFESIGLDKYAFGGYVSVKYSINCTVEMSGRWKTIEDMLNMLSDGAAAPSNAINKITREDVDLFKSNVTFWPEDKANGAASDIDFYQSLATKSAIYPGRGTPLGLAYVALKLNGEAGEFAEHVGKAMRDDNYIGNLEITYGEVVDAGGTLTSERRTHIIKEIGDVLWYLSAACNELGITLSEAAVANLEKLADRTERDALRGSGDDR